MFTFIIGLIIFCAVLLVLVILAQNSKGGGLTSQFGGSGASNMFGVKKTGDFLEKSTWTLVIIIMILALSTNFVSAPVSGNSNEILDAASEQGAVGAVGNTNSQSQPAQSQPADTTK